MPYLGIDIGGTSVKAAAVEDGRVLWTGKSGRYARPTREQLLSAVAQACAAAGPAQADGHESEVRGVGLCVPGLLDPAKSHVTKSANLPGIEGLPLAELAGASGATGAAVSIVNDANATAYDVWSVRRPQGRLLLLAVGTGVGAAVLDDGVPLFVEGESPGHIGQMDVSIEGARVVGPDGGRGGLEGYLGAAALRRRYGSDPSAKLRPGDPPFKALVRTIRVCHAIYRPHHVCLAGGFGIRLGRLLPAIRQAVCDGLTHLARPDWSLTLGDSDYHAALGVARIASAGDWPAAPARR